MIVDEIVETAHKPPPPHQLATMPMQLVPS